MAGEVGTYCSLDEINEMREAVEGLQSVVTTLLIRLETNESQIEKMNVLVTGGATKSAKRAILLNDAVRQRGLLKRPEASKLLKCCHTEALRAMKEAAEMFEDLHVVKNSSKMWVLAVVE